MRNRILMYLFIFSLLFSIFIYVNDKRILDDKQEKIAALENRLEQLKEQNRDLEASGNTAERDFQLEGNESALTYFDKLGIDTKDVSQRIEDEMISQNKSVEDNPLVPYDGINGPIRINKVHVLNHKWAIAEFTDGKYWGEVIFSYTVTPEGGYEFTSEKSFLYPKD